MRKLLAVLTLLALASPARAGVVHHPHMVRLSSMIRSSLGPLSKDFPVVPTLGGGALVAPELRPGETRLYYPGGDMVPSVWDPSKAQVLLEVAQSHGSGQTTSALDETIPAPKLLQALNSVLVDIPADDLRALPPEKLDAVLSLVFDQLEGRPASSARETINGLSTLAGARLKKIQSKPYELRSANPNRGIDREEVAVVKGVPPGLLQPAPEGTVYRHYTSPEGLEAILASGGLLNGFLPYIHLVEGVARTTFKDLTGVFLTLPGTNAWSQVLAEKQHHFVDFLLPPGLPVVQIEKDRIYLVPLPGRARGWVVDRYLKWLAGAGGPADGLVRDVDENGGAGPQLILPIELLRRGIAGVNGKTSFRSEPGRVSGAHQVSGPESLTASLSQAEIAAAKTPQALIAALKKNAFLKDQYAQVVVVEGYTLEEHTLMVMGQFERYGKLPLPEGIDKGFFRLILALHDIGKPAGGSKRQHAYTEKILKVLLPHLGYDEASIAKASALVAGDFIGVYLKGGDIETAERSIRDIAAQAGMPVGDYFTALLTLYKLDAGAYTKDAGGQYSLDALFVFDRAARSIRLESSLQQRIDALAARLNDHQQADLAESVVGLPPGQALDAEHLHLLPSKKLAEALVRRLVRNSGTAPLAGTHEPIGNVSLMLEFDLTTLPSILKKGFLNQHQTNSSGAILDPQARLKTEMRLLDLDLAGYGGDRVHQLLPKYAFVRQRQGGGLSYPPNYGNTIVLFKKDAFQRATWTPTDSLGNGFRGKSFIADADLDALAARLKEDGGMVEAQIWGELDLADVEELWLAKETPAFVVDFLKKQGLSFPVYYWERPGQGTVSTWSRKRIRGQLVLPSRPSA